MATVKFAKRKEVGAVTFNIKEQKFLDKRMQTIDIEKNYSLKLLELEHRIVRVNHRKLKDRVSKIQSHLKADEILELRAQEEAGELQLSSNCLNLGSARKIASAAKRLNLSTSFDRPKTNSATPRALPDTAVVLFANRRPHSVSGAFIDSTQSRAHRHHHHPTMVAGNTDPGVNDSISSKTSDDDDQVVKSSGQIHRPHTTVGTTRSRPSVLPTLSSVPALSTAQMSSHSHAHSHAQSTSTFSSHNPETRSSFSRSHSFRRASGFVDNYIESDLGEDPQEERRQDMLRFEAANSIILEKKKEAFIKDVDDFMDELKMATMRKKSIEYLERMYSNSTEDGDERISVPRRRVEFDGIPTAMPEAAYKERLKQLWKGMTKCRYLRIPDEIIDLSGIKTLARDQIQLKNTLWKNNDPVK